MREILFRGKRLDNGEWAFGAYYNQEYFYGVAERKSYIITSNECLQNDIALEYTEVIQETVGQFTGRIDKNGKCVFEGDILQLFTVWADGTVEKSGRCAVQWWENDQCYVLATKQGYHVDDFGNLGRPEYYEVIGTIYDNPDLLEDQNDQRRSN